MNFRTKLAAAVVAMGFVPTTAQAFTSGAFKDVAKRLDAAYWSFQSSKYNALCDDTGTLESVLESKAQILTANLQDLKSTRIKGRRYDVTVHSSETPGDYYVACTSVATKNLGGTYAALKDEMAVVQEALRVAYQSGDLREGLDDLRTEMLDLVEVAGLDLEHYETRMSDAMNSMHELILVLLEVAQEIELVSREAKWTSFEAYITATRRSLESVTDAADSAFLRSLVVAGTSVSITVSASGAAATTGTKMPTSDTSCAKSLSCTETEASDGASEPSESETTRPTSNMDDHLTETVASLNSQTEELFEEAYDALVSATEFAREAKDQPLDPS